MKATLTLWTPKGTRTEIQLETEAAFDAIEPVEVSNWESEWLEAGFTNTKPDATFPPHDGRAVEAVVSVGKHFETGQEQRVINVYTDNPKLTYAEFRVFPEDQYYKRLAEHLNMNNTVDQAPGKDKRDRYSKAFQPLQFRYTATVKRYEDGSLVYRKTKDGKQKDYPEYGISTIYDLPQAPSRNGNGPQQSGSKATSDKPDATWTLRELTEWAVEIGACGNKFEAENSLKKMVRELFSVGEGEEKKFLLAATPDRMETLKLGYIGHQRDKNEARMREVAAANNLDDMTDEDIPF